VPNPAANPWLRASRLRQPFWQSSVPTASYLEKLEVLFLVRKLTIETLTSAYEWTCLGMIAHAFSVAEKVH
jgi:hypothetical protein